MPIFLASAVRLDNILFHAVQVTLIQTFVNALRQRFRSLGRPQARHIFVERLTDLLASIFPVDCDPPLHPLRCEVKNLSQVHVVDKVQQLDTTRLSRGLPVASRVYAFLFSCL